MAFKGNSADDPEAYVEVECRLCTFNGENPGGKGGAPRMIRRKSLSNHLAIQHKPSMAYKLYVEKFGPEAEDDFFFNRIGADIQQKAKESRERKHEMIKALKWGETSDILNTTDFKDLPEYEKEVYVGELERLYDAVNRDPIHLSAIHANCRDIILAQRLGKVLLDSTDPTKPTRDLKINTQAQTALKHVEERIMDRMKALSLDRFSQIKNGQSINSSPSMLIAGYFNELRIMTPAQHEVFASEERKMKGLIAKNIITLLSEAEDINEEDRATEDGALHLPSLEEVRAKLQGFNSVEFAKSDPESEGGW